MQPRGGSSRLAVAAGRYAHWMPSLTLTAAVRDGRRIRSVAEAYHSPAKPYAGQMRTERRSSRPNQAMLPFENSCEQAAG